MSTEATLSTTNNRLSYRCYNCNHAFHITNTTTTSTVNSSFRCPRCFHRHLLPNYTISNFTPPSPPNLPLNTTTTTTTTNSEFTLYSSDSDSDFEDDFSFEFFNSIRTRKSFVDSLPSVKIHENLSCSICMEEFEFGISASQLPCKHFFHSGCIVPWLNRSNTCPLCRYKLPVEDEPKYDKESELFIVIPDDIYDNHTIEFTSTRAEFVHPVDVNDDEDEDGWDRDEMHDEDGDILMVDAL